MDIKKYLKKEELIKLIKFGLTGCLNTAVDYIVFTILSVVLSVGTVLSQGIGYTCGMLCSYTINRKWTFDSKTKFFSPTMIRFLIANLLVMLLSLLLIFIFHDKLGIHKLIAKLLVTCFTVLVNFVVSRLWVFKEE